MRPAGVIVKVVSLPVERRLLSKEVCRLEAQRILMERKIDHMTEHQIARELFSHALIWHLCERLCRYHIDLAAIQRKADPIDIADYGDTLFRRFCFRVLWLLPGAKKTGSE